MAGFALFSHNFVSLTEYILPHFAWYSSHLTLVVRCKQMPKSQPSFIGYGKKKIYKTSKADSAYLEHPLIAEGDSCPLYLCS